MSDLPSSLSEARNRLKSHCRSYEAIDEWRRDIERSWK